MRTPYAKDIREKIYKDNEEHIKFNLDYSIKKYEND